MPSLRKIELGIVLTVTILAAYLHLVFFRNAGGLWRDEINSVNVANLASIPEVWRHIEFDSFPILWSLLLRGWTLITGGSDLAYRALGLVIGLSVLAALWFNARVFGFSFPFFSLALLGLSPAIIRWGDSVRGYGLGISAILFTVGFVWRLIESPTLRNAILATIAAVIAAQTLYYNAVFIFAICMGGFVVAAMNRSRGLFLALMLVGGAAALSTVPYLAVFKRSESWAPMFQFPELWQEFGARWFGKNLYEAFNSAGSWVGSVWIGLLVVGIGCGIFCAIKAERIEGKNRRRDIAIFALTALIVGLVAYYLFLNRLQYRTQTWYYVALVGFIAGVMEVLLSPLGDWKPARVLRLCLLVAFVTLTLPTVRAVVHTRMTNVDLIAAALEQNSVPGDVILITPWYCGITFSRYYHGTATWATIPPIEDHRYHRVDLLQNHMMAVDQGEPVRPLLQKMEAELKAGHRIWIVGTVPFVEEGKIPVLLLPAPSEKSGWHDWPYYQEWSTQVGYFIQKHVLHLNKVIIPIPNTVSLHENLTVLRVDGWNGED